MPSIRAIRVHEFGGPEQMRLEQIELPEPAAGEARIRHTAIGLNFIDIYERTGLYPLKLPMVLGREAAGVIEQLGRGVRGFKGGASPMRFPKRAHTPSIAMSPRADSCPSSTL